MYKNFTNEIPIWAHPYAIGIVLVLSIFIPLVAVVAIVQGVVFYKYLQEFLSSDYFIAFEDFETLNKERIRLTERIEQLRAVHNHDLNGGKTKTTQEKEASKKETEKSEDKKEDLALKSEEITKEIKTLEDEKEALTKNIQTLEQRFNELSDIDEKIVNIAYLESKHMLLVEKHSLSSKISKMYETLETMIEKIEGVQKQFNLTNKVEDLALERERLDSEIKFLSTLAIEENDKLLAQSYGIYKNQYDFEKALDYKDKLNELKKTQGELAKDLSKHVYSPYPIVLDTEAKHTKIQESALKLAITSFNLDCVRDINTVKSHNHDTKVGNIKKHFNKVNKNLIPMNLRLSDKLLDMKIAELSLALEYRVKKEQEAQEIKEFKALQREEEREQRLIAEEIAKERKKLEKEQEHFQKALEDKRKQLEDTISEEDKMAIEEELEAIELKIEEVAEQDEQLDEKLTVRNKAGYVYIISNIGAYGEGVYKIGVTRRADPEDRVKELSSASVPFPFDTHALIFSEDAFGLETALHNEFNDKRVNLANNRKEFFRVTLDEIKQVVRKNYNKVAEFVDEPEAEEYRQTLLLLNEDLAEVAA